MSEPNADLKGVESHWELRAMLKSRVQRNITSASPSGRTVDDPATAAEYVVNSLMEYPDGRDLVRRIARHLDEPSTVDVKVPHADGTTVTYEVRRTDAVVERDDSYHMEPLNDPPITAADRERDTYRPNGSDE